MFDLVPLLSLHIFSLRVPILIMFNINFQIERLKTHKKRPATESGSSAGQTVKKSKIDEEKTTDFTSNIVQMKMYSGHHFLEDNDGYVHVYTDGSCENNGRPNAIAGYGVYFGEGHLLYVNQFVIENTKFNVPIPHWIC